MLIFRAFKSSTVAASIKRDLLFASSMLSATCQCINLAKYLILTIPNPSTDYQTIASYARILMILEFIVNLIGGIGMSVLTGYFVQGAIGGHNQLFQVSGKKFDPQILIKLIRLVIFLYTLVNFTLWIVLGLQSIDAFVFYRRIIYYSYAVITGIISPLLWNGFISRVINKLSDYYAENGEEKPIALRYLILFKRTLIGSFSFSTTATMFLKAFGNDYLQNYITPVQIIANICSFYTGTVLSTYGIYKSFPNLVKLYSGKSSGKSNKKSALISDDKTKGQFAKTEKVMPATVMIPNQVKGV
ncbi:hypothetical protein HDV01_000933 [Terramyces sp. JEL0728]|nr:hypothetical protein HDV01_000933 [Terramyces sp. JEL0728]